MKTLLPLVFSLLCLLPAISRADEYDTLRGRWYEIVTGGPAIDTSDPAIGARITEINTGAQSRWDTLNTASGRTYLWSDLTSTTDSAELTQNYDRLRQMALAHETVGAALYHNAALRVDILGAFEWLRANRYNSSTTAYGGWFHWQIAVPNRLIDIAVLMYAYLTPTQIANTTAAIDHFMPTPAYTAANRVWTSRVVALRGILGKSSAKVAAGRDGLGPVFNYRLSAPGDGFYRDHSFIQHKYHPYTGGYGAYLIKELFTVAHLLANSTWQVTDPDMANAYQWVFEAYEPLMYRGAMMDMVRGREISRPNISDHDAGRVVIDALIYGLEAATPTVKSTLKTMIKTWIQTDTYSNYFSNEGSIHMLTRAKALVNDTSVGVRPMPIDFRMYSAMGRAVAQRQSWAFSVTMFSERIANYESFSGENLKGWHTGSGMTYVYTGDLGHYANDYWPTVNANHMPGTTVVGAVTPDPELRTDAKWVGGAGLYMFGAIGMDYEQPQANLTARKSWFVLDEEVVALGADITNTDANMVQTIVENRQLNDSGNNALTVNGTSKSGSLGWSETMSGVNWAHLAGTTSTGGIGYYFPQATTLLGLREARTRSWRDINTKATTPDTPVTRNYLSLRINHGTTINFQKYAYVILPTKTAAETAAYASSTAVSILENSGAAQGVAKAALGLTAINFWKNSPKTLGGVTTADSSSFIMLKGEDAEGRERLDIAVSDPTWIKEGTMTFTVDRSALSVIASETDPEITVTQLSPTIVFTADVNAAQGRERRLALMSGIVVDNYNANNAGGSTSSSTGTWQPSTAQPDYWGSGYTHNDNTGMGTKSFTFTPNLPANGNYEVLIWYVSHPNRATNVPVDIIGNSSSTATLNQQANGSQWVSLGEFAFTAGTSGKVVMRTTGTNGYVVADAVAFRRK